jgi:hypothetical protein
MEGKLLREEDLLFSFDRKDPLPYLACVNQSLGPPGFIRTSAGGAGGAPGFPRQQAFLWSVAMLMTVRILELVLITLKLVCWWFHV